MRELGENEKRDVREGDFESRRRRREGEKEKLIGGRRGGTHVLGGLKNEGES